MKNVLCHSVYFSLSGPFQSHWRFYSELRFSCPRYIIVRFIEIKKPEKELEIVRYPRIIGEIFMVELRKVQGNAKAVRRMFELSVD